MKGDRGKYGSSKKHTNKDQILIVRLSKKEMHRLRTIADERGTSMSEVVRYMIEAFWAF